MPNLVLGRARIVLAVALLAGCGGGSEPAPPPALPVIAAQPQAVTASEVARATFVVAATGAAPLSYQWQRDGLPIAGATAASYTTTRLATADSGARFSVVVSNAAGSVASQPALLTVQAKAWQSAAALATGINTDSAVRIAADTAGNLHVLAVRNAATGFELVSYRRVAGAGAWSAPQIVQADSDNAPDPDLGFDATGHATAVWQASDGSRLRIWSSRFDAASAAWSAPAAISRAGVDAAEARIAVRASGDAIAVWREFDGRFYSITSARFAPAAGWSAPQWIETGDAGDAVAPRLAQDAAGNAIAVWRQNDGTRRDVWSNRFEASAGAWGAAARLEDDDASDAELPAVAVDAAGNAVALWVQRERSRRSVWARRYDAQHAAWSPPEVIEDDDAGDAGPARVALGDDGHAQIVWEQFDGQRWNVLANRLDPATGAWAGAQAIETDDRGHARDPQVAIDPAGNAVAVWQQFDGARDTVHAARFDGASRTWRSAQPIESAGVAGVERPQVAIDDDGDVHVLWFAFDAAGASLWKNELR